MSLGKICLRQGAALAVAATVFGLPGTAMVEAQMQANRVPAEISSQSVVTLRGSVDPHAAAEYDAGRMNAATPLHGITLYFQPAQKAELDALVQAQQTPGSPYYHQWLTPAEYANLFGMSSADLAHVSSWLQAQGFQVDRVGNSRTSITFSGTAAQVEAAFGTEMHRYVVDGVEHFANAKDVSLPAALAGVVLSVRNLNDFRPVPQVRFHTSGPVTVRPDFTSGKAADLGQHFLTPDDVATIYDITPAYNSGDNGSGQVIAVLGQSEISTADIEAFQTAAGLTVKDPTITLVPNSGTSAVSKGDEAESDLDLEYAGGIARGATIHFIYVGNNSNYSVYDSMQYAVDNGIGTILSLSYGTCELALNQTDFNTLDGIVEQGASQGQSLIAAAGDSGSTSCWATPGMTLTQQKTPSVNYPASSAFATGVGGTEFPLADIEAGNTTYWKSASGSDLVNSAVSYIPEGVWNDDSAAVGQQYGSQYALSSGGGGVSTFSSRPSWQSGVTGISSGNFRLVPDISLDSSADNAGYLYCTSDSSDWSSNQKASCNSGFRDSATQDLTIGGGTSFATPIFAGMVAIVNQKTGSSGSGVFASKLYPLAANAATYATAFHDITTGSNACSAGPNYCSSGGEAGFSATVGFDEASGLGSVDFNNLMGALAGTGIGTGGGGSFTLSATNVSVSAGSSGTSTVTVTPASSFTGAVGFAVTATGLANGCYSLGNATVSTGPATSTLTIYTSSTQCGGTGVKSFVRSGGTQADARGGRPLGPAIPLGATALAGLLLFGFRRARATARSKAWTALACLVLLGVLGVASGCGSSSGTGTTSTDVPKGTYTITVTGTATASSSTAATTTLTLTVN